MAIPFEVVEKRENERRVQIFDSNIGGPLVQALICKGQQQAKTVAVSQCSGLRVAAAAGVA
jgi:hypothetical protein